MASQMADRERMKTLLVEAIATLCRNGLQYEEELCVEGLIGITLDKKDVFLVSVKESFVVPGKKAQEATAASSPEHADSERSGKKRKKRRRSGSQDGESPNKHKRKGESMIHPSEIGTDESDVESGVERLQSEPSVEDEPFEHNSRSSIDQDRLPKKPPDDDNVVVIDPDLSVKQEIIKQEKHSELQSEDDPGYEPGVIFAQEIHPDSDPNLPVFSSAPVPVNLFSRSPSASRSSSQGMPSQWPSFSPQAPGTSGASQEGGSLKSSTKTAGSKKSYFCPDCNKTIQLSQSGIYIHREKHSGRKHICPVCGKKSTYKHNLKTHMKTFHPDYKDDLNIWKWA